MAEVSNKTLVSIILVSLAFTLLGMWVLYDKLPVTGLVANPTGTVSANVQGTADIFLQNNTVNFGSVSIGSTYVTNGNWSNASQFLIRNDGSVLVNITITAGALWNGTCSHTGNYEYNATNATGNTSIISVCDGIHSTPGQWANVPITGGAGCSVDTLQKFACNFNFTDGNDYSRMDIRITVPSGESAGTKTSTVTLTASQA